MKLSNLVIHDGGYCRQWEYLAGVPSKKRRKFHAAMVSFQHPSHGHCLLDTGYGPWVRQATRTFPERIHRWLTPMETGQAFDQPGYLQRHGWDQAPPSTIFLSHFHVDHIGGTQFFSDGQFVYRHSTYQTLGKMGRVASMQHGFLPKLLPPDFEQRGQGFPETLWHSDERLPGFRTIDYWGDGSLLLVDLPGHALGHLGFYLELTEGPLFYVTDAFWDARCFFGSGRLPLVSRAAQHSIADYRETQQKLLTWCRRTGQTVWACHCPETQKRFSQRP